MKRLVYGIGFNDKTCPAYVNRVATKEYRLWVHMLERCYSEKVHAKHPTYVGCSVSANFKNFSYFYIWCQTQVGFGNDGWHLDKDILVKGNKIYSEDVCVFVPPEVNTFFVNCESARGNFPVGVDFDEGRRKYRSSCTVNSKQKHLGRYTTPQEAFAIYKAFKEGLCKETAFKWRSQIDIRVYNSMMAWKV